MASTVAQNYEQVSYSGPASQHRGNHRAIIGDAVSTRTLLQKESGALCLFDSAAGVVYTLPAPIIGMQFEFQTVTTITSNAAKVITDSATTFILGLVDLQIAGSATALAAAANGTTHRAISSNGSTTGGVIGDRYRLTAISATQWVIDGIVSGSGALATPFATS